MERVASLRLLQAVSNQIHLLTAGRFQNLDAFSVPRDMCISMVKPGFQRIVRREGPRNRAFHRCLTSHEEVALMPANSDWWKQQPLLVLQFDQGPTCTAAAACL